MEYITSVPLPPPQKKTKKKKRKVDDKTQAATTVPHTYTSDPFWLLEENVFFANLKYEADICLMSPQYAKPQTAWNLPSKASTSFLQQYLVSPPKIFGPFPDNIWSPPVGKCRVRANFLCFTVAYSVPSIQY